MVLHYLYDVVWMALPIFLSEANEIDKALVLLCAALLQGYEQLQTHAQQHEQQHAHMAASRQHV